MVNDVMAACGDVAIFSSFRQETKQKSSNKRIILYRRLINKQCYFNLANLATKSVEACVIMLFYIKD